jgi:hypothetical protein
MSEDEIISKVSDYLDGALPAGERDEVAKKVADDAEWKRIHEELVETRKMISGMHKAHAPDKFSETVTSSIYKMSAGRFFGRKTLGDRVPFGALVVVAALALVVIGYVMWASPTGSYTEQHERGVQHGSDSVIKAP